MPEGSVCATIWRTAALACAGVLAALGPAEAAGRCAFVNVGLLPGFSEPEARCFKLEMTCPAGARYGCFKVPLQFKSGWVEKPGQPRMRELSEPFGYIDPKGVHWDMPAGAVTDGASIPLFFQLFIGGPWTENYVKAAALHDFYIRRSSVNAADVHEMFYLALLAAGTSQGLAQRMYSAVANFGPRWKSVDMANVEAAWRSRKAALDDVIRVHKEMWEAHQENERKRDAQAAIDRALLSKPLEARTRVFTIQGDARARADLDAFVEAAARDNILHFERDATLIASLREQLEAELQRPVSARDNVLVVRFMKAGPGISKFSARNQVELTDALRIDAEISERLDAALLDAFFPGQGARR
jgi:hypothetical protein